MGNMDRKERRESLEWVLRSALEGFQADLWTALPGTIESFDPTKMTCVVKPSIQARVRSADGKAPVPGAIFDKDDWWWVSLPVLGDVPVVFPSGGGFTLTFPLLPGDPVLVVFASRCIDAHWQSGGVQPQAELRMHDLSDGFAIPGHRPLPSVPPSVSESTVQLRSDDGAVIIELTDGHVANVIAPGGINLTGPVTIEGTLTQKGDVTVTGDIAATGDTTFTGVVQANGHHIDDTHIHSGVTAGGANSGPVSN
jgi:hypothetical protein